MHQVNLESVLRKAEAKEIADHAVEEVKKRGILRGGNSGCLTEGGDVLGSCHRTTLGRYLGVSTPNDEHSVFYFAAGYGNEDRWIDLLTAAWDGKILREEETPIRWTARSLGGREVPVTGRPDVVLCDNDGQPITGIELKKVCSSYRAVKVFLAVEPDTKHLIQAAHYSWQLGKLPWILSYTSDSSYDTPYWAIKKYSAERKIKPGRHHFYCAWQDDTFCFIHPETGETVPTRITSAGIQRYYDMVLTMEEQQDLGPRPSTKPAYGDGKDFDQCTYCAFAPACDKYENDYASWLDAVKIISEGGEA